MTALLYIMQRDRVLVAMDSLALTGVEKRPLLFTSKIYTLPHLNGVICGTGIAGFMAEWFSTVQAKIVARDMVNLDKFTPQILHNIYQQIQDENAEVHGLESTIYHFGYSEDRGIFVGYAYRSTNNFHSEGLQYDAIGIKPPTTIDPFDISKVEREFIRIMEKQKAEDDNLPIKKRVGIGGEIHFLEMERNFMRLKIIHRFSDYREVFNEMFARL